MNYPFTNNPPPGVGSDPNTYHYSIDAKIPFPGQADGYNSLPVVLPQEQINAITTAISGGDPEGLATADKQDDQTTLLAGIDDSLNNPLTINLPTGASTSANQTTANASLSSIDSKLTSPLTINLPTGASTAANQTTANNSLISIDSKTPALGQALAASSVPVVLTASQISTLTPPPAITGFATESTLSSLNSKVTAVNTGAVVLGGLSATHLTNLNNNSFDTVTNTGNIYTRLSEQATALKQDTTNSYLSNLDIRTPPLGQALAANSVPVVLTAAQVTTLTPPAAITGFATETTLSSINTKTPALGQTTMAGSTPVVIASNQTTLPVSVSSLPLPSGAATEASLSTLSGKIPSSATLQDAFTNPATTNISSLISSFNGSTWDRIRSGASTATTTVTGYINNIPFAKYNSTDLSLTNGQLAPLGQDTRGYLKVCNLPGTVSVFRNQAANATLNIKSTPGYVCSMECRNTNAAARFFQIWNTATTAGTGSLLYEMQVNASSTRFIDQLPGGGLYCSTGIAFGFSTTSGSYVAGSAADHVSQVCFI